jgi:ADP-heptose:LPS heptosyltransferase
MDTIKFLIIRFSSIGDIVLTTPVIRNLKQQAEDAEVHFLTKLQYRSILENNPYIDKIHILDKSIEDVVLELRREHFHYVIDLHNNLRTARVKLRLHTVSFSFNKLNLEKWLMVNFKKNKLPEKHIVDRYMETIRFFIDENDQKGLDFFIPENEEVNIQSLPDRFRNAYIAFAIGAQHATKRLPDEKIISICRKLNRPIILLGDKNDSKVAEKAEKEIGSTIYNACGKYSLNQSASLVKQARIVISHDTGLMHIAASYKKQVISIWGNTIPEFGMYPYLSGEGSEILEVKDLKCRPCTKIGFNKCPKKHFNCMNDIDEERIVAIVEKAFSSNSPS